MKNLFKALANFQQECPTIHKGTKGYGYSYASLPEIFEVINPLLKKHKLGFTQLVEGDAIKTILFHYESGEQLETTTNIPQELNLKGMNQFQVAGSGYTYYRRYALSSILGIVTDVDNDAAGEQVKTQQKPAPAKEKPFLTYEQFDASIKKGTVAQLQKVLQNYKVTEQWTKEINNRIKELKTK